MSHVHAIAGFLSLSGAVGAIVFSIRVMKYQNQKPKIPHPVAIAMQISICIMLMGVMLKNATNPNQAYEFGGFGSFIIWFFAIGIFLNLVGIGRSYLRLYNQLSVSVEQHQQVEIPAESTGDQAHKDVTTPKLPHFYSESDW